MALMFNIATFLILVLGMNIQCAFSLEISMCQLQSQNSGVYMELIENPVKFAQKSSRNFCGKVKVYHCVQELIYWSENLMQQQGGLSLCLHTQKEFT